MGRTYLHRNGVARLTYVGPIAVCALSLGAGTAQGQARRIGTNPLTTANTGNQERFIVQPTVNTTYDTNVFRASDQRVAGPKDNFRVTPGVDISIYRYLGRIRLQVGGNAGYDFNTRFKGLDQVRIDVNGTATTPVGAICQVAVTGDYQRYQFDLRQTSTIGGSTSTTRSVDASASCNRSAGFSPVGGISYSEQSNGSIPLFDANTVGVRGGIAYAVPSLGTVTLFGSRTTLDRPKLKDLLGIDDGTTIDQAYVSLVRSVSPRIQMNLRAGYSRADPKRAGVAGYSGSSYDAQVSYLFSPRFVMSVGALRDIRSQSGVSATYVIYSNYHADLAYQVSQRSNVRLSTAFIQQTYRGEDLQIATDPPRGRDDVTFYTAVYSYDLSRRFRLNLSAEHQRGNSKNDFYDYKSTSVSAGLAARF